MSRQFFWRRWAALIVMMTLAVVPPPAMAAQQTIGLGTNANDGTGDTLRSAFGKVNGNFTDLYRTIMTRAGASRIVTFAGDSTAAVGSISNPPGSAFNTGAYSTGSQAQSYQGWLQAVTGNGLVADYVNNGFPGSPGGIGKLYILSGGACPANTALTVTFGAPTGSPANQAGSVSVPVNAAGQATGASGQLAGTVGAWVLVPTPGSGYSALPALSGTSGCTTPPTFGYALTGYGTYGVPGSTTANTAAVIQNEICPNSTADTVVNMDGTNDLTAGVPAATIISNKIANAQAELACGKQAVITGITSRNQGTGGWTAAMDKQRLRINAAMRSFALASRTTMGGYQPVVYVDIDKSDTDPTSTTGNPLSTAVSDGLHQSPARAFFGAMAMANALRADWSPITNLRNSQNDTYDATNNPAGNMLGSVGLMMGTGGTVGSCAGTVASSWVIQTSGTGTLTCSSSIETSRTDGLPGQRQVITYSNSGGGTSEKLTFAEYQNQAPNLTLGTDQVFATADIDVSNMAQVEYLGCQLLENAPSGGTQQTAVSANSGTIGAAYPLPSSAQIAKLQEAKILPDFGLSAAGSFKLPCRTPPITTQLGGSGYSLSVIAMGYSNTGTMTLTAKIGNVVIQKVAQ